VRWAVIASSLVIAFAALQGTAFAGGDTNIVDATATPSGSTVILKLGVHEAARGQGGVGSGGPSCDWNMLSGPGPSTTSYDPYTVGGITWQYWSKTCGSVTTFHLIPILPPSLIVPEWRDDLEKLIPKTDPVWSPLMPTQYVSHPTSVWLDKAKTADIKMVLPVGNATMFAKVAKVEFNPGIASDTVACAGIPSKWDDCTYTYRQTSKNEPDKRYQASVSVTWAISWTSPGDGGTLPSAVVTTDVPIAVAKIQTVGS
jgi:hypothetical protein